MTVIHLPIFATILFISSGLAFLLIYLYRLSGKGKRSPLTRSLLRSPGQSLHAQIADLNDKVDLYLFVIIFGPMMFYTVSIGFTRDASPSYRQNQFFILAICGTVLLFFSYRLWKVLKRRASYILGLDGELYVGQELNNLMLHGYRVFHDFPAEKFNIDHVVVGPKGVFAVETKGRMKRRVKGGGDAVKITYDGTALRFPGWSERKPVEQAKSNASWLAQWLSSAVGEHVAVRPVLAIPGWFLIKESPDNLLLFNGKNPEILMNAVDGSLNTQLITRIAHQLEQRCRDVEPFAYPKK